MTDYYISTRGSKPFFYILEEGLLPEYNISLMYDIKKVSRFSFIVFRYLGINLEAKKEDRYKWFNVVYKFNLELASKNVVVKTIVSFFNRIKGSI